MTVSTRSLYRFGHSGRGDIVILDSVVTDRRVIGAPDDGAAIHHDPLFINAYAPGYKSVDAELSRVRAML